MENNNILNTIWQTCSNVKELMSVEQMQQTAIAFTFLRRVDCLVGKYAEECEWFYTKNRKLLSDERLDEKLINISGGYPFYNVSGYTFWNILRSEYSLDVVLNSYFQGFSKNIQTILDGMNVKQIIAILQRKSRYLVDLFDKFAEIDMSVESISNEDFVYLITSLFNEQRNKRHGNTPTPLELSKLVSKCLLYKNLSEHDYDDLELDAERGISIYDPVSGIGSMLTIAGFAANKISNTAIYGQEISEYECAIAKALALLSGFKYSCIENGNTLTDDMLKKNSYQYIIAHLPFGRSWNPFKNIIERESISSKGRFYIGLPKTNDSQFLFIEHILSKMNSWYDSRAAFLTSESVLWNGNASSGESRIRRWLFKNDKVETIIALPGGALGYTNIPIYVWILSDKKDRQGYVRLIDTSTLANRNTKNFLNNSFVEKVVDEYISQKDSKISKWVYNEEFGFYEVDILKNRKRETINIPLGTDIQDFINREIKPYFDGKITIDYPSAEIGYAVKFGDFFKSKEDQILPLDGITNNVVSVLDEMSELKSRMTKSFNLSKMKSVPQHWKKIQLGSIVNVVSGTEKKSLIPNSNGLPFLSVSYLRDQSSTEEQFEKRTKNQYITEKDVLFLVKGANSGEVFMGVDGILSSSFVAIRSANENIITSRFLYYLLKGYEKQLRSMSKGANVKFIDKQSLLNFKCLIPPIHEQQNMTAFLDSIVSKIDEVTKSLRSTDNIFTEYRQTLIENVVQGKVRFF